MIDEKDNLVDLRKVQKENWPDVKTYGPAEKMQLILFLWEVELSEEERKMLWASDLAQVIFLIDEIKGGRSGGISESVAVHVLDILKRYFEFLLEKETRKELNIEGRFKQFLQNPEAYLGRVQEADRKSFTVTPINVKRR